VSLSESGEGQAHRIKSAVEVVEQRAHMNGLLASSGMIRVSPASSPGVHLVEVGALKSPGKTYRVSICARNKPLSDSATCGRCCPPGRLFALLVGCTSAVDLHLLGNAINENKGCFLRHPAR
jgi:hypothetical protein